MQMVQVSVTLEDSAFQGKEGAVPGRDAQSLDHIVSAIAYATPHPPEYAQHPELTSELTSILAPPTPFLSASTSVILGLDLCSSSEELEAMRCIALDKIFATFPSQETAYTLLDTYFEDVSWFYHCLHEPAFRAEHKRFWEMVAQGRRYDVDPAWLALFCMVMALGLSSTLPNVPLRDLPPPRRNETCQALYAAALRLFQLSGYARRPQFRIVQLVVLFGVFNIASPAGDDMNGFVSYLADGVRVAQKLRLHLLTDDPSNMPPEDPAFPPGPNSVKRQTALRVWGLIAFVDTISANARLGAYLVHNEHCTTPPLANLNTSQLSSTEWQIDPAPRSVWTDASMEYSKHRGGLFMKLLFDKLVTHASDFSYDTVLSLDREMRAVVSGFPDALATESVRLDQANPKLRRQRFSSLAGAHSRLVRLHRPYVLLGYSDVRYRYSTASCLKAARICVTAHENGREELANIRIMYSHTLSAAIVLASNLFYLIDSKASSAEIEGQRDILCTALDIFDKTQVASPMLRNVLTHGAGILRLLIQYGDQRWASRKNGMKTEELESFPQILREIAKQLQLAQTPPSTAAPPAASVPPQSAHYTNPPFATGAHGYTPSLSSTPSQHSWSPAVPTPQPLPYPPPPVAHYPSQAVYPSAPPSYAAPYPPHTQQPSGMPYPASAPGPAPPFAPQLLADMGLRTATAAPGAFDASWHGGYGAPPSRNPQQQQHQPQQEAYGGSYAAAMQGVQAYGLAVGGGEGAVQPAWLMDGRDGARALLEQIGPT
ncbi:hypothetical protein JCM10449v2_001153 [Rhodotorula kratochvilovae]